MRDSSLGFYGVWILMLAFWWGVLLKRHELLAFISTEAGSRDGDMGISGGRGGFNFSNFWYGSRMFMGMAGAVMRPITAPVRAPIRALNKARINRGVRRTDRKLQMAEGRAAWEQEGRSERGEQGELTAAHRAMNDGEYETARANLATAEQDRDSLVGEKAQYDKQATTLATEQARLEASRPRLVAEREDYETQIGANSRLLRDIDDERQGGNLTDDRRSFLDQNHASAMGERDILMGKRDVTMRKIADVDKRLPILGGELQKAKANAWATGNRITAAEENVRQSHDAFAWQDNRRRVAQERIFAGNVEDAERSVFGQTGRERAARDRNRAGSRPASGDVARLERKLEKKQGKQERQRAKSGRRRGGGW